MQRTHFAILLLPLAIGCSADAPKPPTTPPEAALKYPAARRSDQVDDYHGTKVADPYRWLEDPDSPESRSWIEAENKLTFGLLEQTPQRDTIRQRLTKLWDYERFGIPTKRGGRYLFSRNDGLQNQSVLYTIKSLDGEPRLLLDPNTLSPDGTVALAGYDLSDDGSLLAYGIARAGSDWQEWRVRDVETAKDTDDLVQWVKFSGASWSHSGDGFYYSRYDQPVEGTQFTGTNYYQKLYFHKVGESQDRDTLVYDRPDEKEWGFHGSVTDDGRWLVIHVTRGTERKNQVFYRDLEKPDAKVIELITGFDAQYDFIGNDGSKFWFLTDLDAPLYRVIAVELGANGRDRWQTVIPEAGDVLENVDVVGGRFFACYLHDASSRVELFDLAGKSAGPIELPGLGSVGNFSGQQDDTETFYAFTSFTAPTTIYRYDIAAGKSSVFRQPKVDFKPDDYETKQVFYTSADGTRVPMFIVHRRGLKLDGSHPTYLYAYGGFNISLTPGFDVRRVAWLELGGIFAMPNLRGGGEYGRAWHEAGMKSHKQNVFDDFIAAAQYLIEKRYTSSQHLAIVGGSNGGLLVGACLVQRPELFGAALPKVGVLDMLRFHKFTIGWAWTNEFGSSDNAEEFQTLLKYSPLQNIKPGACYPPTLIETADHDDRVVPAHSFKFAAALQAAQSCDAPILIRIETTAGHGAGTPTSKQIDETADSYAFLVKVLGMERSALRSTP